MLQPKATTFNIICLSLASGSPPWHSQPLPPAAQPGPDSLSLMEVSPAAPGPVPVIDLTQISETPPPPTGATGGTPPPTAPVGGGPPVAGAGPPVPPVPEPADGRGPRAPVPVPGDEEDQ